jgi:cell division septation protein DedD
MMDNFRYHFKRGLPFIITILLLLLLPAYIFLRKNGFVFFENKGRIKEILRVQQESNHVADSLKKIEITSGVLKNKQQDSMVKPVKEENPLKAAETESTYFIIVGSFSNKGNTKQTSENYRRRGFETSIISATNRNGVKIKLVSVKAFKNLNEAEEYLKEFKEKSDPAAWIYSKK